MANNSCILVWYVYGIKFGLQDFFYLFAKLLCRHVWSKLNIWFISVCGSFKACCKVNVHARYFYVACGFSNLPPKISRKSWEKRVVLVSSAVCMLVYLQNFVFGQRKHSTQLLDQVGRGDSGEISCPLVCNFFAGWKVLPRSTNIE